MTGRADDNREGPLDRAIQEFVDARLRGEQPDIDEFVKQYPGLEDQIREKIRNLQRINTLFASLVEADESDFEETAMAHDLVGCKVGSFEIVEMIGRGGMGVVYLARDCKLDRHVAIKSMPAELQANPTARARFTREAKLLASLSHPNIAVIYDIIEQDEGVSYLVLEYVPGETLSQRITRAPLEFEEVLSIACQVAEAVSAAHDKGVVHRDIKPGNIKIIPEGRVKVLDFGLAKVFAKQEADQDNTVTQPGRVIGTPAYMSPEQTRGKPTDHRTDIWSFGCVLYEMLTGQIPFQGDTTSDILAKVLEKDPDWQALPETTPKSLIVLLQRCLEKDPDRRLQSAKKLSQELMDCQTVLTAPIPKAIDLRTLSRSLRRPKVALSVMLVLLVFCAFAYWLVDRTSNVRWARNALPQIEHLLEQEEYLAAFNLAQQAEKYIPKDPTLVELWPGIVTDLSIVTTPPGADVFFKEYSAFESKWEHLGLSPLENIRFPRGAYRWKIEKKGYESIEFVRSRWTQRPLISRRELHEEDTNPSNMVLIPARNFQLGSTETGDSESVKAPAYWIDKYEVTNQQFKEFVDHGGYQRRDYWKHEFIKDGKVLSWEQAVAEFRDKTGRFGPSTWEGGTYPKGHENYPVSGISWFEAAAYAEFAEKSLPTIHHWIAAAPMYDEITLVVPFSNFEGEGPAPVGSHPAIGRKELYDMAGNVKEWCWNATDDSTDHRYILGGGWSDPSYLFTGRDSLPAWDRSAASGFRCVHYPDGKESLPDILFRPVPRRLVRDYSTETPVSDEEFQQYMKLYAYDRTELNAVVESVDDSPRYWRREKITFDAAYSGERMIAYLFLPKGIEPPYQTVIYFPGASARRNRPFENSSDIAHIDFVVVGGRALLYPIYLGTYERQVVGEYPDPKRKPIANRDWRIQQSKDMRRSIDYLETRKDIDSSSLAYYGGSLGAWISPIMLAVEDRIKVAVCVSGGLPIWKQPPEVDPINLVPHVKIPLLMVNAKEDYIFPYEASQRPMYELWGGADEHKKRIIFPGPHGVPGLFRKQIEGEVLNWLDRYLGPVE